MLPGKHGVYPLFVWGATGVDWVDLFKKACIVDGNEPFRQNGFIFLKRLRGENSKKKYLKKSTTQIKLYRPSNWKGEDLNLVGGLKKYANWIIFFPGVGVKHQKKIELPPPTTGTQNLHF